MQGKRFEKLLQEWEPRLEEVSNASPEQFEAVVAEMFKAVDVEHQSVTHKFTHLLQHEPVFSKKVIEEHPIASRIALQQAKASQPGVYAQIVEQCRGTVPAA